MNLALSLLAGHMLGDWVVQTDWEAAHKARPDYWTGPDKPTTPEELEAARGTSWRANQQHMLTYHLTLLVALLPFMDWVWPWGHFDLRLPVAIAFSWLVHSFIDRRWPVKWLLRATGSPAFAETALGILTADQTLHIATLVIIAAILGR